MNVLDTINKKGVRGNIFSFNQPQNFNLNTKEKETTELLVNSLVEIQKDTQCWGQIICNLWSNKLLNSEVKIALSYKKIKK